MGTAREPNTFTISTKWIVEYRWAMFSAIAFSLFFVFASGVSHPPSKTTSIALAIVILLSITSNVWLRNSNRHHPQTSARRTILILSLDSLVLTLIFMLSGGANNPFTILYLAELTLSVVVLGVSRSVLVWLVSNFGFLSLFLSPISQSQLHQHTSVSNHLLGMFVAFFLTSTLIGYFLLKASRELVRYRRQESQAKKDEEEKLRLASLTTLAAETAHELATPLSTIAISIEEILNESQQLSETNPEILAESETISQQVVRCKQLLERMIIRGGSIQGELPQLVQKELLINQLKHELDARWPHNSFVINSTQCPATTRIPFQTVLLQICSLVKNSVQAGAKSVTIQLEEKATYLIVDVIDDGNGIPPELIPKLGSPFTSSKANQDGMGLGLFVLRLVCSKYAGVFSVVHSEDGRTHVRFSLPKVCKLDSLYSKAA